MNLYVISNLLVGQSRYSLVGASKIVGEFHSLEETKEFLNNLIKENPNEYYTVSDVYGDRVIYDTSFGWKI